MSKRKRSDNIDLDTAAVERLFNILRPGNESYSFDDIKDVAKRFPNAIHLQNPDGWLPLHCACYGCTDKLILEAWPRCMRKASLTIIQTLVEA